MNFFKKLFRKDNVEKLKETIDESVSDIENNITEKVDKLKEDVDKFKEDHKESIEKIKTNSSEIFETVSTEVKKTVEDIKDAAIDEYGVIKDKINSVVNKEENFHTTEEKISVRLTKNKENLFSKLKNLFSGKSKIDEKVYEELEELLIQSDLGYNMTSKIMYLLQRSVINKKISTTAELYEELKSIMSDFLISENNDIFLKENELNIILVVGVNGVGKTTTIGKLASKYTKEGKKVVLAAADTFRAAAVEQLEEWSKKSNSTIIKGKESADPSSVVYEAVDYSLKNSIDILIIDTAGRLHNKSNLMRELEKINNTIIKKIGEEKTFESLLIIDATTGQNGLNQAKEFNEVTKLTGFIVTKLDGTSKGGIIFAISDEIKKPIKFIGVGEKVDDLLEFNPNEFVNAIFKN